MSHDEFTKLFTYMQAQFTRIDERFTAVDQQFDRIYGLLDADGKKQETDEQERLAMSSQLDRHDSWIRTLAQKTHTEIHT